MQGAKHWPSDQELVRGSHWIKTQVGSRQKHVGIWPLDPGETSAGRTQETGLGSLKSFCRREKQSMLCVCVRACACVCVFSGSSSAMLAESWKENCLAGNADGQAMPSQQTEPLHTQSSDSSCPRGRLPPPRKASFTPRLLTREAWYSKGTTGRRFHLHHPGARTSWKIYALFFS